GTQKLFGWFGGPGLDGAAEMMDSLALRPGRRYALMSSVAETAGGASVALGLVTPLGASALMGSMMTAIRTVHLKNGPWVTDGGYEYNLVLIAAMLAIVDGGPGPLSIDRRLGIHDTGAFWTLASLAAAATGSAITIKAGGREPAAQAEPVTETPHQASV
ncbi:MAG: DoxX family protein, partial [Trebonia sp.]